MGDKALYNSTILVKGHGQFATRSFKMQGEKKKIGLCPMTKALTPIVKELLRLDRKMPPNLPLK